MSDQELTPEELEELEPELLPAREEMSIVGPVTDPLTGGELPLPDEPDIGDPEVP
jgi:hypothetical protein